jgi:nucleotide-binding universal stress UspA family protein
MSTRTLHRGILVGIDGSPPAKVAVDWAARVAASRNVPLTLVHVLNPPLMMTWPEVPMPATFTEWQEQEGVEILEAATTLAQQAAHGQHDVRVHTEMLCGPTPQILLDLTKDSDMVVVGSRGHGALARTVFGSVSSSLVRHAHCPVAVIHDADPRTPDPARAPVLLGIDGSPASEMAIAIAFDEASRRGVELIALHAVSDTDIIEMPGVDYRTLEQRAEELLGERLAGWQERYPEVTVRREVVWSRPARALVDRSAEAQLVVVGSHGRGGFAGMLLGSVSSSVVQAVHTPVIVARRA